MTQKNESLTDIVFILDRSGSMGGRESDTIGGYNSFLSSQQAESGKARVSTVLFDNAYELIHERMDIAKVLPLTPNDYYVRGSTALLDAIGKSIYDLQAVHLNEGKTKDNSGAIFVIITDGMENASHVYSYAQIRELIHHKNTTEGWEFIYLGADLSIGEDADRMGFDRDRQANFDKSKTIDAFNSVSDSVRSYRSSKTINNHWRDNFSAMDESRDLMRKLPIFDTPEGRFLIASDLTHSIGEGTSVTVLGKSHSLAISPLLQRYRKISGVPIDGMIGQDILSQYQVVFEPRPYEILVHFVSLDHDFDKELKTYLHHQQFPLSVVNGHLSVMGELYQTKQAFIFDTITHMTTLRRSLNKEPLRMGQKDFHLELGLFNAGLIELDLRLKKNKGFMNLSLMATVIPDEAFVGYDHFAGSIGIETFKDKRFLVLNVSRKIFTVID